MRDGRAVFPLRELGQAVGVADDDQKHDGVEGDEESFGQSGRGVRSVRFVVQRIVLGPRSGGGIFFFVKGGDARVRLILKELPWLRRRRVLLSLEIQLEPDRERGENHKKPELHTDSGHVNVHPQSLYVRTRVGPGHDTTYGLDEKRGDVENHKHSGDAAGGNLEHAVGPQEEMYHPSQQHVNVSVDPERCEEDEELLDGVQGLVELVVDGQGSYDVPPGFPCGSHDEDRGESFAVADRLSYVGGRGDTKQHSKDDCGGQRWTIGKVEIVPCTGVTRYGRHLV